jgi:hypothetical protein
MKRLTVFSVAALVTGAVLVASAAAALPEFSGPFPKPFVSKGGTVTSEPVGNPFEKLVCKGSTGAGQIIGPRTGNISLRLTGCIGHEETFKIEAPCTTPGSLPGEIVTSALAMTLGYINQANKVVGLALNEPAPVRTGFTEFECRSEFGVAHFIWGGSVIGKLTPVNKKVRPTSHFTLNFTQAGGRQKPGKLEGGPKDVLMGRMKIGEGEATESQIGLSARDEVKFAEAVEVKA